MQNYIRRILTSSVYEVAHETPLDPMRQLSARLGVEILLKREDLQSVFSFKIRGAHNKIAALTAEDRARGVICASAGNHAQGVALSAARLEVRAVIVMPVTTPTIKVHAVSRLGGEVVLHGDGFDAASAHAADLAQQHGFVFVHPFDDVDVIAGQGTIGMELLRQRPGPIGAIYIPVGGGGLAAGIAMYVKFLRPEVKIFGVEPDNAASMKAAIAAGGTPVKLDQVGVFADGVAVRQVGTETFRLCRELLDGIVTVTTDEICAAIKDIFDDTRAIAEPAGALALAGLRRHVDDHHAPAGPLIAINSGANINFDRLRHVAERAEIGERAEALLAVTIPEVPGSYRAFIRHLGDRPISEFNYRYARGESAQIFVGIKLKHGDREKQEIIDLLRQHGHAVIDMTDNELAKLHVRYMVGGRAPLQDEVVYRFQFPERPGALLQFLEGLRVDWNISLFHYRNHGADYGRVLAGIQVPTADRPTFQQYLQDLSYPYWDETDNPAYQLFLDSRSV